MKTKLLIIFALFPFITFARVYDIKNIKVHDGDTITADVILGFNIALNKESIRFATIDTPELVNRNKKLDKALEYKAAVIARDYVKDVISKAKIVQVVTNDNQERGKYGRVLGRVLIDGKEYLDTLLIQKGYAIEYGKKWTNDKLQNVIKGVEILKKGGSIEGK